MISQYLDFFAPSDFQTLDHTSMEILCIQLIQMMHKSQFPKTDPRDWFCGHMTSLNS